MKATIVTDENGVAVVQAGLLYFTGLVPNTAYTLDAYVEILRPIEAPQSTLATQDEG